MAANVEITLRWREALVTRRLWYVAGGATAVLAAIAAAFGYLVTGTGVTERERSLFVRFRAFDALLLPFRGLEDISQAGPVDHVHERITGPGDHRVRILFRGDDLQAGGPLALQRVEEVERDA